MVDHNRVNIQLNAGSHPLLRPVYTIVRRGGQNGEDTGQKIRDRIVYGVSAGHGVTWESCVLLNVRIKCDLLVYRDSADRRQRSSRRKQESPNRYLAAAGAGPVRGGCLAQADDPAGPGVTRRRCCPSPGRTGRCTLRCDDLPTKRSCRLRRHLRSRPPS